MFCEIVVFFTHHREHHGNLEKIPNNCKLQYVL